ncbi:TAXI family TRAP transporter solute-binding subunit [Nocardia australiensis]|uniref:TAXI family TRAP transporter solute-binding subunit n=1 Tax=Nocardia australiensis TaxID=2887191 RepID=UPI001D14B09A|nr:TAXI family TRAP transporter solute-binding subunit [Nocardia australiensis]
MIDRRRFLALTTFGAAAAASGCSSDGGPVVRLASGEVGGFYHAFAQLLTAVAVESGGVRIEPVATSGSQENLERLADGEVDAALALSDSVTERHRVLALGRVYENYLQLAVRADGPIHRVADLRGTRVNLGAAGSGAAVTGERLLWAAGIDPTADVVLGHRPLLDAVAAVVADDVDALLWAGGVPTGVLDVPRRMRLVDLGELAAPMRDRFGYLYERVEIPADAYPGGPAVHTIGVANLLLAAPSLSEAAAEAIVDLLVTRADALVPAEAAGTQFLDTRSLIGTGFVPLHPGAAAVYRRSHG